jgi:hypothetical protein
MTSTRLVALSSAVVVAGYLAYAAIHISRQYPKFYHDSEHFGLIMVKGGYRSWFLSWSDGKMVGRDGRMHSVINDGRLRFGYRVWPRYEHVDLR